MDTIDLLENNLKEIEPHVDISEGISVIVAYLNSLLKIHKQTKIDLILR